MPQSLDYEVLLGQLKLVSTFLYFFPSNETSKRLSKLLFILPEKLLLSSKFSNFCTSLFLSFFLSWPLLILYKNLIDDKSLWHHYVPKLDF